MINSYKKPEILAPCGSYDIMIAAINAGADACYFGGNKFGARAYATNFDLQTSLKAIDYAHVHGASLYLTVNTLFKEYEIKDLYDYLLPYYEAGLDAVIVQDLGVFALVKEMFPDMNIHCSTQMNITSKYAAKAMKELGASRIVTAREMSLAEISDIKNELDIEIESFVHGAMCYSYSGRCLMSSLAGGRSGNRGRCAQPCRMMYDNKYILSMKDMCTLTDIPKLIDAGIDSFKIEGRMKNEYYVASAVDAYNQLAEDYINGCFDINKAEELKFKLANIYNRGGFCGGYYFMHNGPEMMAMDRPNNQGIKLGKIIYAQNGEIGLRLYNDLYKQDVLEIKLTDGSVIEITSGTDGSKDTNVKLKCPKTKYVKLGQVALRTRCNKILDSVKADIIDKIRKQDIYGEFVGKVGEKLSLTVGINISDKYIQVTVTGDEVSEANGKQANEDDIKSKLCQLGNTCYRFAQLSLKVDGNSFIPASAVKNLRRNAISKLEDKICEEFRRQGFVSGFYDKAQSVNADEQATSDAQISLNIGISTYEQYKQVANADFIHGVYLDYVLYNKILTQDDINKLKTNNIKIYIELPQIINNSFSMNNYYSNDDIDGFYIRNIDGMFAYADYMNKFQIPTERYRVCCGDGLYGYNNHARGFVESHIDNVIFELPKELNKKEMYSLNAGHNELVVYEYQQVMLSAQCVVKNKNGCNKSGCLLRLKDQKDNTFYAKANCHQCYNTIYNGVPFMILDQINKDYLDEMNIKHLRFNFTIEDSATTKSILDNISDYAQGALDVHKLKSGATYTSGHFNRGVE